MPKGSSEQEPVRQPVCPGDNSVLSAFRMYRAASSITGVLLILVCVEMFLKYILGVQVFALTGGALVELYHVDVPEPSGLNLSVMTLIFHGWFYVFYLWSDLYLWSKVRFGFALFIVIALGGVVPLMSFVVERYVYKKLSKRFVST